MSPSAIQVTSQSGNDERGTPVEFIRALQDIIGGPFALDPCAGCEPVPIAETRFTKADNGLAQDWSPFGHVYCNPPYSELDAWLQKCGREAARHDEGLIFTLVPANTSTQWFQRHATLADYLVFIEGRLKFAGTDTSAPFASLLLVYGDPSDDVVTSLDDLGAVYTRAEIENAQRQSTLDELLQSDGGGTIPAPAAPTADTRLAQAHSQSQPPNVSGTDTGRPPAMLDLSRDAPAVPQGLIDFRDIRIGDTLTVTLDTDLLGIPEAVPGTLTGVVETGEAPAQASSTGHTRTTLTVVADDGCWLSLQQDPNHLTDVVCSVAPDGREWRTVPIVSINRVETAHTLPAIEPYGPETTFVC